MSGAKSLKSYLGQSCLIFLFCLTIAGCAGTPKTVLRADDIPVGLGTTYEAFQNDPGSEPVRIYYDTKGPWDFTKGPDSIIVKSRLVKTTAAPDHEAFPGAGYAEQILPSEFTGGASAFNFAAVTPAALLSFGQSVRPAGQESVYKSFTKSERLLVFPLRVGDKWTDTLSVRGENDLTYDISKEVVGRGEVKVPAGIFFDCFMVRVTKVATAKDGTKTGSVMYTWWAPGVGLVAAAGSRTGETDPRFRDATYLFRLKEYRITG